MSPSSARHTLINRRRVTIVALAIGLFLLVTLASPSAQAQTDDVQIAVVVSDSSKAFSAGDPPHNYSQGTDVAGRENAAATWVTDNGQSVRYLSDEDLTDASILDSVDVIILPYTWSMNEAASLTVRSWIRKGGGLIAVLSSPRVFLENNEWRLWVEKLNYEAWEWGPLSEAYQMMFVNDPTPSYWEATLRPGHPIVTNALAALGLFQAKFTRPGGSGAEFGFKYNSNVTSILDFGSIASPYSQYNGYSAAQATHYGLGRVVYFDIPVLDFLPHYNANLADDPVGGGHDQGDLVDALLAASVDWAANGGGYGSVVPAAATWGEVDIYGSAIYVRQWVTANGTAPVSGSLTLKIFNPSGRLVAEKLISKLGIEPGRTHLYNWSYLKGSTLDNGQYRVVLEYKYTYPTYALTSRAETYVTRSQGTKIKTAPVATTSSAPLPLIGDFDGTGTSDLAMFSPSEGVWWVLEAGGNAFSPTTWDNFVTTSGWTAQMAGDFNGDGRHDIAQYHPSNGTWWISRSTGTAFATTMWADFVTATGWESRLVGDFNGDGRDDIAQYHPSNGTWWISRSTGNAFTTTMWADFSTTSGWKTRVVGDFNGDGRDDIANYHEASGRWWVSRSTGSGFVTELWASFSTKSGWVIQVVGDFNGDGRDDIANYHGASGRWWVSRSTGSGFVTELWASFSTLSGWQARLVGDFNDDGRDDIAQFHPSNGTWWVSRSTGSSFTTQMWADFTTATGWENRVAADFNDDGRTDIAQSHSSNGTWWVSLSNGSAFATSKWVTFPPPS